MTHGSATEVTIVPMDPYNEELVSNVHPPEWTNPEPVSRYNLVVIGAGTAGLVSAAGAAALGAKVALVEKFLLGGDCLNAGCVPSKCVIRSSRVVEEIRRAENFGILLQGQPEVDFGAVMERMRRLRARVSHHDSAQRFKQLGVDVFLGEGRFAGPDRVQVNGKTLRFKKAIIATGSRAVHPPIPGLKEAGFLTNESVFSLTERPGRLAVLGGGPIGCELAQAFGRLGSRVTIIELMPQLLGREDQEAADLLTQTLHQEGIDIRLNTQLREVSPSPDGKKLLLERTGRKEMLEADEILVGVGRAPSVKHLNLEAAGVRYGKQGVEVNDYFQTTNPHIYAAGDVCMNWKFTHAADAAARIVIQNALFLGRKKQSSLVMPWCTYTDPEIAHVGLSQKEAREKGLQVDTFVRPLSEVDRAVIDGEEAGFVKIVVRKGSDRVLGALWWPGMPGRCSVSSRWPWWPAPA